MVINETNNVNNNKNEQKKKIITWLYQINDNYDFLVTHYSIAFLFMFAIFISSGTYIVNINEPTIGQFNTLNQVVLGAVKHV